MYCTKRQKQNNSETWLSAADFGRRLGLSPATIKRMRARGEVRAMILNSRTHRYPASELNRLQSIYA